MLASTLAAGCSVFGVQSVEEAPYEVVRQGERFEIREYAPTVVAETLADGSYDEAGKAAFGRLFAYISGENDSGNEIAMTAPVVAQDGAGADAADADAGPSEKIEMTVPVTSERDAGGWRYRFVLPESYDTLESAPRPLDPDVSLARSERRRTAVARYSGRATDAARSQNAEALAEWLASQAVEAVSAPRFASYDPPWTLPPFRRNEVLVDVDGSDR